MIYYYFGKSLLLTIMIELFVAFLMGIRRKKEILLVVLVNTFTNPLAVLCYYLGSRYIHWISGIYLQIPIEIVVVLTEICIYQSFHNKEGYAIKHPIFLGVLCNLVSWGTGVILSNIA